MHLPAGLSVRNEPTITIAPGTKFIVGHQATVEFGYLGSHVTVQALGTVDKPIKFCGEAETAGYFAGVVLRSGVKATSVFRNVLITDGGAPDAGLTLEMPLIVQGVQVRNSGAYGVKAAGFGPGSSTLIVSGAAKSSVLASAASGLMVPAQSVLTGNKVDAIDLGFTYFDTDTTFSDRGVPYRVLASTKGQSTAPTPTVNFEAGVDVHIGAQKILELGQAKVHALGSADKPILFRGLSCKEANSLNCGLPQTNGFNTGGEVSAGGTDLQLQYVEFRSLGWSYFSDAPPYDQITYGSFVGNSTTPLKATHVTVTGAIGWGIKMLFGNGGFSADSSAVSVTATQGTPGLMLGCNVMALPADITVNTFTSVDCYSTALTSSWPVGVYAVGGFSLTSGGHLTLKPGTKLTFASNGAMNVASGATLSAVGTAGSNAQFNGTGYSSSWVGIVAEAGSTTTLDYVTINGGGASGSLASTFASLTAKGPVSLTHSAISNSLGWGMKKAATDTTDYTIGNTFTNNLSGNITNLP